MGEGGPLAVDEVSRGKVTLIAQHLIRQPNGCHLPPLGKAILVAFEPLVFAPNTVCVKRLDGRTQFAPTGLCGKPCCTVVGTGVPTVRLLNNI